MGILRKNSTTKYNQGPTYKRGITTKKELEKELKFYSNLSKYGTAKPTKEQIGEAKDREINKSELTESLQ
tara:strand:- start:958 stop:1167 length:210 start_codon:yes stop_codon:yes gene_type:complete